MQSQSKAFWRQSRFNQFEQLINFFEHLVERVNYLGFIPVLHATNSRCFIPYLITTEDRYCTCIKNGTKSLFFCSKGICRLFVHLSYGDYMLKYA